MQVALRVDLVAQNLVLNEEINLTRTITLTGESLHELSHIYESSKTVIFQ